MPLKVPTPTGVREVIDLKVMAADGTPVDVQRAVVKTSDDTVETVWERFRLRFYQNNLAIGHKRVQFDFFAFLAYFAVNS